MIKNWLVTGDAHGQVMTRLRNINTTNYPPEETALIILGDAGINFYLDKTDLKNKKIINNQGFTLYCVRGNHEERPENIDTYHLEYDANVGNMVWVEEEFPNIKFFADGGNYVIDGHPCLVIGGGYSVDKYWRLQRAGYNAAEASIADPKKCGWFKDECLTQEEMTAIFESNQGKKFDFILSHTCPYSWRPTDLFLPGLDQSSVDKTMELWLDKVKQNVDWNIWLFGHYHDNRLVRPKVEMYYRDIEDWENIMKRWENPNNLDWGLKKDPNYETGL